MFCEGTRSRHREGYRAAHDGDHALRGAHQQGKQENQREGSVRLHITIGPDGSVVDAVVVTSRPSGWFETAAINGVKRWRYQPSGRTISTDVEIEFKLK